MDLRRHIEARLRERVPAGTLRQIGGAASMELLRDSRIEPPAAIVLPDRDTPEDASNIAITRTFVTETYAVVIAVRAVRDPRGTDGADACQRIRGFVRDALLGWVPDVHAGNGEPVYEPMRFGGGQFWDTADKLYVWRDHYSARTLWSQASVS